VQILSDITDEEWGKPEFSVKAINGHSIRFGEFIEV
jgi:hypothetical protein